MSSSRHLYSLDNVSRVRLTGEYHIPWRSAGLLLQYLLVMLPTLRVCIYCLYLFRYLKLERKVRNFDFLLHYVLFVGVHGFWV